MKKILLLLFILTVVFGGFIIYNEFVKDKIPILEIEEDIINIDEIYVYGTHLNIHGEYNLDKNAEFILYNGEFISYDINILEDTNNNNILEFNFSNLLNAGLYLDDLPIGNYYMFIRVADAENIEETNEGYKYYALKNTSEHQNTTYYSMNNYDKKIIIDNEDIYPTMMMNVTKNDNSNVYDIVLDPGHGGMDGGASKNGYKETDFTMDMSIQIKKKLEDCGFKVKLTHEKDQLKDGEKLEEYGNEGRAVIPRTVEAKYLFSIHLNSSTYSSVSGLEIYTAKNIDYDFAKDLVANITNTTGLGTSNNKINKIDHGIYSRNFTKGEIDESIDKYKEQNLLPYDINTKSNYYYMIRETGGIVTGAYVDNRNNKIVGNPYTQSNVGTESYILELGYLSNKNDLDKVINGIDKYVESISKSICNLYDTVE